MQLKLSTKNAEVEKTDAAATKEEKKILKQQEKERKQQEKKAKKGEKEQEKAAKKEQKAQEKAAKKEQRDTCPDSPKATPVNNETTPKSPLANLFGFEQKKPRAEYQAEIDELKEALAEKEQLLVQKEQALANQGRKLLELQSWARSAPIH